MTPTISPPRYPTQSPIATFDTREWAGFEIRESEGIGQNATIVSVYPKDLITREFKHGGGLRRYPLAAAPPDGYSKLVLSPTWTTLIDTSEDAAQSGSIQYKKVLIPARGDKGYARLIIKDLAGDAYSAQSGFTIGVGVIAGDDPTDQELSALRNGQRKMWEWLVRMADQWYNSGQDSQRKRISHPHQEAWQFLGSPDPGKHPWTISSFSHSDTKSCPACGDVIKSVARVCRHCSKDLVEFYLSHPHVPVDPNDIVVGHDLQLARAQLQAHAQSTTIPFSPGQSLSPSQSSSKSPKKD